jgi:DNA-binding transcriptional LysR family regulator
MLDIISLKCFAALAQTGSFNKAAEKIGRTQSAVSQQIAKLEEVVKRPLFLREKNNLLTQDGEILLSYANRILALHQEIIERFHEPELVGEVRFGVPEHFATVYLPEVLAEFSKSHPRILLNVECDMTLKLLNRFREGEFDLVLLKMASPEDLPNGFEVWKEKLVWVTNHHTSHLADHNLEYIPLVLSPKPCIYRARAIEALEQAGKAWRIVYTSPSFAGCVAAVKAGLGLTVLPKKTVPDGLSIVNNAILPDLMDAHLSLITTSKASKAVTSLAEYVIKRLI